jgi:predicted CopG family antitoxin
MHGVQNVKLKKNVYTNLKKLKSGEEFSLDFDSPPK